MSIVNKVTCDYRWCTSEAPLRERTVPLIPDDWTRVRIERPRDGGKYIELHFCPVHRATLLGTLGEEARERVGLIEAEADQVAPPLTPVARGGGELLPSNDDDLTDIGEARAR